MAAVGRSLPLALDEHVGARGERLGSVGFSAAHARVHAGDAYVYAPARARLPPRGDARAETLLLYGGAGRSAAAVVGASIHAAVGASSLWAEILGCGWIGGRILSLHAPSHSTIGEMSKVLRYS